VTDTVTDRHYWSFLENRIAFFKNAVGPSNLASNPKIKTMQRATQNRKSNKRQVQPCCQRRKGAEKITIFSGFAG